MRGQVYLFVTLSDSIVTICSQLDTVFYCWATLPNYS